MTVIIDPQFSVYGLLGRIRQTSTVLTHRRTMTLMSYEIENTIVNNKAHVRLFAGFQRFSKFIPQMERYKNIAQYAEDIYVFGIEDTKLPPIENIHYIPLKATDQLAKEWFVISHGKSFSSALATEELTHIDDPDNIRKFQGIWSFNLDLVDIMEEWLASALDIPSHHVEPDFAHNLKIQATLLEDSVQNIQTTTLPQLNTSERDQVIKTELKEMVEYRIAPELKNLRN